MSGLLMLRALLFAGECVLASLLLPVLAFGVTALLRRRAALRHLVWTTMFGVLAVLPFVALLLPPRRIVEHVAAPVAAALPLAAPVMAVPPPALFTLENGVLLLVALWLAGLCWQLARVGLGTFGLMRLRHASAAFASEIETGCAVRLAAGEDGPSTFGILRPLILLPRSARAWPVARMEAVLRHEAAHVARRDVASQFLARLVCALYWLNPLLWLAARALRRDAEIAADDAVLASGMTPSLYAAELVRLAAQSHGIMPGIAMARPPLTQRVQAVLAENSSRKGVSRMDIAKTVSFGLAATLLLGVARFDLAVAQDASPKLERNVEKDQALEESAKAEANVYKTAADAAAVRAKAEAGMVKAATDAAVARARAKAATEADPAKKAQYRRDAEQIAVNAAEAKAQADRAAQDASRMADVAHRAAADRLTMPEAERRMAQSRQQVDGARQSDSELQRGALAMSETALARTQEALARQAQAQARDKADPGKQQIMQLMADSVAVARQEIAQARERVEADRQRMKVTELTPPSGGHAEASSSADSSVTVDGTAFTGNVHLEPGKPGEALTITADRATAPLPRPNNGAQSNGVSIAKNRDGVQIEIQVSPMDGAMNKPEVRNAILAAVNTAVVEAEKKIAVAMAIARVKAGLPAQSVQPVPARPVFPQRPMPAPLPPAPPPPAAPN